MLHGSTGRVCSSQRLFPSKDTESAVMKFMEARLQSITHNTVPKELYRYRIIKLT